MTPRRDPFDRFDSVDQAHAYRIQRLARLLRHHAHATLTSLGVDLSPEQWVLLWRVYERGPCSQRSLADPLLDDRANITRMIDRLCATNWLQRIADPKDGRAKRISLTKSGRRRFESMFDRVLLERRALFGDVGDADLATFERVLAHVEQRLT